MKIFRINKRPAAKGRGRNLKCFSNNTNAKLRPSRAERDENRARAGREGMAKLDELCRIVVSAF